MWLFVTWLLPLSMMFLRLIRVVACISTKSRFNGWIILHCIATPHFLYGHLSWFCFSAIMSDAAVNIPAQVFVWTCFFCQLFSLCF